MDGDALNNEDFGSPFIQLADAKHWNQAARLNISFTGSDTVLTLAEILQANYALLATTASEPGPWNRLWHSVGMNVIIRGLDVTAGLIFVYGIWVLFYVVKAAKDDMNYRRYLILVPGIIYLPLSIAFAPYKVTVPWRNAVYYLSLLFPFISLGLQITMWSKLVYRIKRKKANKLFSYYSYVTIFVPVISSFLDGIGWLIPSVPIIRMIGERGFSYVTPAVILVQAGLIFYYAVTFFRSLKGIAISTTTRTALVKITVLNMAMISFFVLMLLSRIVSVMGLNMRSRAAYLVELIVFRFSFLFFYAACFRTLAIRQPTGSTVDSKGASSGGGHLSGTAKTQSKTQSKSLAKNQNQYAMDEFGGGGESSSSSRHDPETGSTPSRLHYNKHLSNHASKGFTIPDPSNPRYLSQPYGGASGQNLTQGYVPSSGLMHSEASRHNLNEDYPDPYKFGDFGHLTHYTHGEAQSVKEDQSSVVSDDADKESVYGGHRFPSRASDGVGVTGSGRVVGTKPRNSEGYSSIP
ncbi:hypothetical protein BGW38_000576 [Lunasporangiospora selenospora]|uniref:Uncharacterized protein n=1 Tax=Lunasporangiospora selenospora TaxID=979761 RepID=A0A9P6G218_9FUNG|nr:hypothetical protein BGW38_000576 [Lunasporangiospora selenospora]